MKKIGEYTAKGSLPISSSQKIQLFDGRFDTAYRVVKFQIAPTSNADAADAYAKLATDSNVTGVGHEWHWDSNIEIAWVKNTSTGGGTNGIVEEYIDPDNMIVEDLYIFSGTGTDGNDTNYMIHLEKYDISDWQGALAMVRNKSQA